METKCVSYQNALVTTEFEYHDELTNGLTISRDATAPKTHFGCRQEALVTRSPSQLMRVA